MRQPEIGGRAWTRRACAILLLGSLAALPATAQQLQDPPVPHGLTTPEDLEAFVDGLMAAHMQSHQLPAAVISVVKDGELFFAKGYGYADLESREPVDPERTLFRPGSISKLFTWTAVMQLVEQGKLDLDADVNEYLTRIKIPDTFPEPITLTHLLTHTPGFEDGGLWYLFADSADRLVPLHESLAARIPRRVRPPGTYSSYSNYGTALAGLIVANVSGIPFEEYVERNIFEPLGMQNSTFREPLPEPLAAQMATGYQHEAGVFEEGIFEFVGNFAPAGALSSSANDMARFMIAHLQNGQYGEARILKVETARRMHGQLYTLDPRLPGMCYGFYETRLNDQHIIGHAGDTIYFHSNLALLPEHGVGLYVSYVSQGGQSRLELLRAFMDRYYPVEEPVLPEPAEEFAEKGERYAGTYRFTRHNWSTIEKAGALFSNVSVAVTEEGRLLVNGLGEHSMQFVEVGPGLFQQIDGWHTLAFEESDGGGAEHMFLGMLPFMPLYRVAWHQGPGFNYLLLGLGALFFVSWPATTFLRRKQWRDAPAGQRWAGRLGALVGLLNLLFVLALVVIFSDAGVETFMTMPSAVPAALVLPIVVSVLTAFTTVFAVRAWKDGYWTFGRRLHYTLFALLAVGWVWFYYNWNVLGFQY